MDIVPVTQGDVQPLTELSNQTFVTAFAAQNTATDRALYVATLLTKSSLLHPLL